MAKVYAERARIKQRIVARVAAGETVKAICAADAAMPCAESVSIWARRDGQFAAELAQARRRGDWMRRFAFDEAKAGALLAGLAAGARVADLLGRPGMPSQRTYRFWRRTQVGFQGDLFELQQARARARHDLRRAGLRGGGGRPCRGFDQAVADRILVRVARGEPMRRMLETDPGLPCRAVVYRWRAQQPEWDRALQTAIKVGRRARPGAVALHTGADGSGRRGARRGGLAAEPGRGAGGAEPGRALREDALRLGGAAAGVRRGGGPGLRAKARLVRGPDPAGRTGGWTGERPGPPAASRALDAAAHPAAQAARLEAAAGRSE